MRRPRIDALCKFLWAAALVSLPVTSFRFFPAGEGTFVRPLAFFPVAALLIVLFVNSLVRRQPIPRAAVFTPLAAFLLLALIASFIGILLAPTPVRGQTADGRVLRAWITLLMGLAFFVTAIWMNRDAEDVRFSVRWLLVGFVIDALWSGLQAATFYLHLLPKSTVTQWQRLFSLRELIRTNRISGMAYEPSWLAGQIATIYMPWLLAAVLTRVHITRFRWLEPLLLSIAAVLVLGTFSRGGILTVAASTFLTLVLVGRRELLSAWQWFTLGLRSRRTALARLVIVVAALALLAGAALFIGEKGYISRLWETRAADISEFLIQNSAGARGAYLASAMQVYSEHPWTGVGPGMSGLYMYARLPDWALTTVPEIARQLSPESNLYPNPKSLYVRLLAETGMLGFLLFAAFQLALAGEAWGAARSSSAIRRFVGVTGVCTWLALIFYNATQDSFATPNLWLNSGILIGLASGAMWAQARPEAAGAALPRRARRRTPPTKAVGRAST